MLSLEELLDSKEPIYVLNNSSERGRIIISLVHPGTGKVETVIIPVTWIPICITDLVPRGLLKHSLDFRQLVAKGLIKIVPKEEAEQILSQPEAKEELKRLYESTLARKTPVVTSAKDLEAEVEATGIRPKVQELVLRIEAGTISPKEAINKFKSLRLSKEELSYVISNVSNSKVRKWAEAQFDRS